SPKTARSSSATTRARTVRCPSPAATRRTSPGFRRTWRPQTTEVGASVARRRAEADVSGLELFLFLFFHPLDPEALERHPHGVTNRDPIVVGEHLLDLLHHSLARVAGAPKGVEHTNAHGT